MKAAAAQFLYETNSFNPAEAPREVFTRDGIYLREPDAIRARARDIAQLCAVAFHRRAP